MDSKKIHKKIKAKNNKTLSSESIIFFSTMYTVISLLLVIVVFRFWLKNDIEVCVIGIYALFSVSFLIYIGIQSYRRTQLNKLPSTDILKLCYLVKEKSNYKNETSLSVWHVTSNSFNQDAMEKIFGSDISQIIPQHDYFSYMLSEKLITVNSIIDIGTDIYQNKLSISLSSTAADKLQIYENSINW